MDENQVSDVYVRLGNDFNIAVAAFSAFEIDMKWVNLRSHLPGHVLDQLKRMFSVNLFQCPTTCGRFSNNVYLKMPRQRILRYIYLKYGK